MERKYQVFISSTYKDLKDERIAVLNGLLMLGFIPIGMEAFVANDAEQFEVIKKSIDTCDAYILIIGRRYGSTNKLTGLSYTEMEYNYATSKNMPIFVFALNDDIELTTKYKIETDEIKMNKLNEFKTRALENRMGAIYNNADDLKAKVIAALSKFQFKTNGWVRSKIDIEELIIEKEDIEKELEILKCDNERLKEEIDLINNYRKNDLASLDDNVVIRYTYYVNSQKHASSVNITWGEIFSKVAIKMIGISVLASKFREFLKCIIDYNNFKDSNAPYIITNQFIQLGLLNYKFVDGKGQYIYLTALGKKVVNECTLLKKNETVVL